MKTKSRGSKHVKKNTFTCYQEGSLSILHCELTGIMQRAFYSLTYQFNFFVHRSIFTKRYCTSVYIRRVELKDYASISKNKCFLTFELMYVRVGWQG